MYEAPNCQKNGCSHIVNVVECCLGKLNSIPCSSVKQDKSFKLNFFKADTVMCSHFLRDLESNPAQACDFSQLKVKIIELCFEHFKYYIMLSIQKKEVQGFLCWASKVTLIFFCHCL